MNRYPALALIELDSIARGTRTGDAVLKKAPIDMIRTGTVQPGRYLVLFGGSVGDVEESYHEGLSIAGDQLRDSVFLPGVDAQVHDAVMGARRTELRDALGVIETSTVASVIHAADAGTKGAEVLVREVRLADGMGGKGIVMFAGLVADVEAAVQIGAGVLSEHRCDTWTTIIPALDEGMLRDLENASSFHK